MTDYVHFDFAADFSGEVSPSVWEAIVKHIKSLLLPEQSYGEDRPSQEADFATFKTEVVSGFNAVNSFLKNLSHNHSVPRDIIIWSLLLCGEHSSPCLWTTEETLKLSTSCMQTLCSIHGCSAASELLLGLFPNSTGPSFKQALLLLRPKLMQESWRKHPGAVLTYQWLLLQVCSPYLSEYLDLVSPTALIIMDDHDVERRLIGIHCLSHIIDNVARTEMCQRGLHQVFYKTLEPLLWQRDANLVEPGISCLIRLLNTTERGYTRSSEPGMWDMFDDTLSNLLSKMMVEDQVPLRKAYIKSMSTLLAAMGPSAIRWNKPLVAMFDEYLQKESFDTRIDALCAMKVFIRLSSSRLSVNGDSLLYLLLRTLHDVASENGQQSTLQDIEECILSIREAAPDEFLSLKNDLKDIQCNSVMNNILLRCWENKSF